MVSLGPGTNLKDYLMSPLIHTRPNTICPQKKPIHKHNRRVHNLIVIIKYSNYLTWCFREKVDELQMEAEAERVGTRSNFHPRSEAVSNDGPQTVTIEEPEGVYHGPGAVYLGPLAMSNKGPEAKNGPNDDEMSSPVASFGTSNQEPEVKKGPDDGEVSFHAALFGWTPPAAQGTSEPVD